MTVATGRAYETDFITKLVSHLTAIPSGGTDPYWKQVNSGIFTTEGVILESKGTSGDDSIFVQIKKGASHYIIVRLLHEYVPNQVAGLDGTFVSATPDQQISWYSTNYPTTVPFDYWLSFDRDRIMLFASADKFISNPIWGCLLWIGLPSRLSKELDSTAASIAVSRFGHATNGYTSTAHTANYGRCMTLRNASKAWNPLTNMMTMTHFKSVGWGGNLLLPHIFLDSGEGTRSIMHGVHPLIASVGSDDFKHGDEIMVGSKRYTIFQTHYNPANLDSNSFPTDWMAVEQLR